MKSPWRNLIFQIVGPVQFWFDSNKLEKPRIKEEVNSLKCFFKCCAALITIGNTLFRNNVIQELEVDDIFVCTRIPSDHLKIILSWDLSSVAKLKITIEDVKMNNFGCTGLYNLVGVTTSFTERFRPRLVLPQNRGPFFWFKESPMSAHLILGHPV